MKFTQGDWRISKPNNSQVYITSETAEFRICEINANEQEADANAELIKQAPNLYKILSELVELKKHKEANGRDLHYVKTKPIIWAKAKLLINHLNDY